MLFRKNSNSNKTSTTEKKAQCFIAIASITPGENLDIPGIFNGELDAEFKKSPSSQKSSTYFKVRCEICDSIDDAIHKGKKLANTPNRVWILTMGDSQAKVNELIASGNFSKGIIQATNSQDWQLFQNKLLAEKDMRIFKNNHFKESKEVDVVNKLEKK